MPAPFSPGPADRPSASRADQAPSTQTSPKSHDPDGVTPLANTAPPVDDPPTVISGARQRSGPFDPDVGLSLAGRKLGHFELIESVGAGGMAAVLKARDLDLGRVVALKILPPDMATDPENIVRFKQEARAAAKLDHENVARVYYIGEDQGLHFIAFEFVEGDNLRQLMDANGGTIPVADAVTLLLQVAAGLAHASERGVVHRDIKPSNIIVTPDGRAKIVDMGLARSLDPRAIGQLTETGVTLGTFDYISPEQAHDPRAADVRSDIYSLGCTFYHALTGHVPVPEGTAAKKLDAQRNLLPPDPRTYDPSIPEDVAVILGRMMAKDPDRRYQHPDHLAANLRSVARKLGVPIGPTPSSGPPFAEPLPQPPRMSVAWMLTTVAVLAVFVAILVNTFPGPQPAPPWQDDKTGSAGPIDPIDPGVSTPAVAGQRDAANVEDFVALMKLGAKNIRLTGTEYDLVQYRDADGHPLEALLTGDDVRLEGVRAPTLRLAYAPDGKARRKTLTLRGPTTGNGTATVRGIRFVLWGVDDDDEDAGLLIAGFDRVTVEECTFATGYRTIRDGPAALEVVLHGGSAAITKCYFAPGCVGLAIDGPGRVTASECAIAPHQAGVRILRRATLEVAGETDFTFTHCSALVPARGALVDVGDMVPAIIHAGYCLFSGPDRTATDETPAILRQRKTRAESTRYDGEPETRPNIYYNVGAYSEDGETYSFAQAAQEKLPIKDVERPMKHPWEASDPFALLKAKPPDARRAFTQNTHLPELRVKGDPNRAIVGTRFLGTEPPLYTLPLPSPDADARDLTVKVWDPSLSPTATDLPPGVFPTLKMALAAVRPGDTLLIRYNGPLEVEPCEFTTADTRLTIKPDINYKPVLKPAQQFLKRAVGIFKLYGGPNSRLVLDGLHFRLPADRAPAVAVLPGGGQLEIRNAVITMEDGEDLAAVSLTDPRGEMMMGTAGPADWPVPKVTIENVFIRGKGRLVAVKGSRPFEIDIKNTLSALDSTLIDIDPSTADPPAAGSSVIHLTRLTTYLGGSLLHFRAADRKAETGPTGLTRTEVTATGCLFAAAGIAPDAFIRADRLDSLEQVEKWFTWRGKGNVYGYEKKNTMVEIRPTDQEVMPLKLIEGDRWLERTLEEGDPFVGVKFEYTLPEARQTRLFIGVRLIDFQKVRFNPPRPEMAGEVGATDLPALFPDE
jgi:serine/threonine protein kinase